MSFKHAKWKRGGISVLHTKTNAYFERPVGIRSVIKIKNLRYTLWKTYRNDGADNIAGGFRIFFGDRAQAALIEEILIHLGGRCNGSTVVGSLIPGGIARRHDGPDLIVGHEKRVGDDNPDKRHQRQPDAGFGHYLTGAVLAA